MSCQQNEKKINDFFKSCAVTAEMHKNTTVVVQTKRALSELGVLAPAWHHQVYQGRLLQRQFLPFYIFPLGRQLFWALFNFIVKSQLVPLLPP